MTNQKQEMRSAVVLGMYLNQYQYALVNAEYQVARNALKTLKEEVDVAYERVCDE